MYVVDELSDITDAPTSHEPVHEPELIITVDSFIQSLLAHGTADDWDYASSHIVLSDETIRLAADKVNWNGICKYQDISHELLMEFRDRVNVNALYYSKFIKYETVREFFHQLQTSQLGAPRRPTLVIKRVIRQGHILQLLGFKKLPPTVLAIIKSFQ